MMLDIRNGPQNVAQDHAQDHAQGVASGIDAISDPDAARSLWCAVIEQQWELAFLSRPRRACSELNITQAKRWFGTRDFYICCALAGVEGDFVLPCFKRRAALGEGAVL